VSTRGYRPRIYKEGIGSTRSPVPSDHTVDEIAREPDDSLPGRVLDVRRGVAFGWLRRNGVDQNGVVQAIINGRIVASATASLPLRGSPSAINRLGSCGFRLPLFNPLSPSQLFTRSIDAKLTSSAGVTLHETLVVYRPGTKISKTPFDGYCERIEKNTIYGWAFNKEDPRATVDVTIYVDDRFVGRIHADQLREDLKQRGIGDGRHAFSMPLHEIADGKDHKIEVQIAMTGIALRKSPLILKAQPLKSAM
jgi:hypothetical protein